jgi:hypothetical protein
MKKFIGENPSVTKKACEEINSLISSTTAKFKTIAKVATDPAILLVDERCVPNTSKAMNDLKNIIKKYSLTAIPA